MLFDLLTYDDLFLLQLIDYSENRVRFQGAGEASQIENKIKSFLTAHKVRHTLATYNDGDDILHEILWLNR